MSPKDIVAETQQYLTNNLQNQLPKKLQGLFRLGVKAFTLQPLVSCNGNARMSHAGKRAAAEQQMFNCAIFLGYDRGRASNIPS